MPSFDPVFDPSVLEALKRARDVPSVPAVALEVLRVAQDEEADAEALASVISLDPALAAKILKVSNSALFSGRSEITTLKRACAQVGFKTVKLWALSFALVDCLDRPDVEGFDYDEYWKRSLVRAVSAKLIAETVAWTLADEAFITGLLSRIGQLLLASCLSREYKAVLAACPDSWPSQELQKRILGYSSDELGAALLYSWNLPSLILEAILLAQDPSKNGDGIPTRTQDLARIMSLAAQCEELVCGPHKSKALAQLRESGEKFFELDPDKLEELLPELDHRTEEIAESLSIKVKGGLDMAEILRQAQLEMLRETIEFLQNAVAAKQRAVKLESEKSHLLLKAQTDPLTGLADRRTFEEALGSCVVKGPNSPPGQPVGLLMIDVDSFKSVNDTYGHPVGDQVLQLIARRIREFTRDSGLAARYGGEEFAVVAPATTFKGLKEMAERIRSGIEKQRLATMSGQVSVTVSVGGAHTETLDPAVTAEELIQTADRRLCRAKQRGRNQCDFAESDETSSLKESGSGDTEPISSVR